MAGTKTDFVIYNDEFHTGVVEYLEQRALELNAGTNNTIRLVTESLLGDFEKETFFEIIEDLVTDRNPASTAPANILGISQEEQVNPKVNKKIGPVEQTIDSFRKIGRDPSAMSFIVGQQSGKAVMLNYLNTGVLSAATAIKSVPELTYNVVDSGEADTNVSQIYLNRGLALLGDARERVRAWVAPGAVWSSLIERDLSSQVSGVADLAVYGGVAGTLGKPIYVTDVPGLVDPDPAGDGSKPAEYTVLGLTENAIVMTESEGMFVNSEVLNGRENIIGSWQAEFAFNVSIKGFSFTGGASPTTEQLGTAANWKYIKHDIKSGPGIAVVVNAGQSVAQPGNGGGNGGGTGNGDD